MSIESQRINALNLKVLNILILILCFIPILASFFMETNGYMSKFNVLGYYHELDKPCKFKVNTGYDCLTCRFTRTFIYMSNFDFIKAIQMKFSAVLFYLFLLFQCILRLYLIIFKIDKFIFLKSQILMITVIVTIDIMEFVYQYR
ncbi:MAG: DUF2752 domain-containing protein [Clostridiales bacterium]